MKRQSYKTLVSDLLGNVDEIYPWDLLDELSSNDEIFLVDIRCPHEYEIGHINNSVNIPRGILEIAADYGYEETEPRFVEARDKRVIVICRSGNRSILAAHTLQILGYKNVASLKTGIRGWFEYEQPLKGQNGEYISPDDAEKIYEPQITIEKLGVAA